MNLEKGCNRAIFQYWRNSWNTQAIRQSSNNYFWSTECDFCSEHSNRNMAELGTSKYISFLAGVWPSVFIQRNFCSVCSISRFVLIWLILYMSHIIICVISYDSYGAVQKIFRLPISMRQLSSAGFHAHQRIICEQNIRDSLADFHGWRTDLPFVWYGMYKRLVSVPYIP